ncbi:hypothetical protein DERP_001872 [Dermatophagoides pteronyssinus]|uniref:Uncharacterized protein n=1 Tax=Dermatophagoides pteronyssinus TaxID=6956 RepID=A0ABQ8JBP8_DERPT|nr:hypothetical protein DERP_001872 [Dermatophagoides pteronyssinus]
MKKKKIQITNNGNDQFIYVSGEKNKIIYSFESSITNVTGEMVKKTEAKFRFENIRKHKISDHNLRYQLID